MKPFIELLKELNACEPILEWADGKEWKEVYETCDNGDWLLWLFARTNPEDIKELTLAKGYCANTVRHLMKDRRSIKAVDAAIKFGKGEISMKELSAYSYAAADAYIDATYVARTAFDSIYGVTTDADATHSAYCTATNAAYAAYAAYAAATNIDASSVIFSEIIRIRELTADICREHLPINIWNIS